MKRVQGFLQNTQDTSRITLTNKQLYIFCGVLNTKMRGKKSGDSVRALMLYIMFMGARVTYLSSLAGGRNSAARDTRSSCFELSPVASNQATPPVTPRPKPHREGCVRVRACVCLTCLGKGNMVVKRDALFLTHVPPGIL